ncbi:HOS3 [Sanghuangporus weigelae]
MSEPSQSGTAIFLQDACYLHRFLRSTDLSLIVERPERLRALKIGFSAAIARLEEGIAVDSKRETDSTDVLDGKDTENELAAALERLDILQDARVNNVDIIASSATVNLLDNKAVKFVHGDIDGDIYLESLIKWTKESMDKIKEGGSEIPEHLSQGDLYLCPESLVAIQGALGTVCEAVDKIMVASQDIQNEESRGSLTGRRISNAFVAIRPPGHHCGEDTPSGFCFVNNVIVAAAHAHLNHGIRKVVVFDIDLHHGNGTQSLAWQINEETYRQRLETKADSQGISAGLEIFYGSIHDVLSFPCEDGVLSMVQAASVSIHGLHGQHIENIHLQEYRSEEDFWKDLYPNKYSRLLSKAEEFVKGTDPSQLLVFISCGFDACEHEYPSMSRHNRRVPASFYHRFAVDARNFAYKFAAGKLISVLEGGYSDRTLISGGMAHLCGLVDSHSLGVEVNEAWWNIDNLTLLEKMTRKKRGGKVSLGGSGEKWLERAFAIFQSIETILTPSASKTLAPPPSSRTLRERKPPSTVTSPKGSPKARRIRGKVAIDEVLSAASTSSGESIDEIQKKLESLELDEAKPDAEDAETGAIKKVPRVILRVKEPEVP